MRLRTVLAAAVLAAVAALPLAGVASAQPAAGDRDCRDFAGQAAAQTALDSTSGDPQRLDVDGDGVACEEYFGVPIDADTPPSSPAGPAPAVEPPVVEPDPAAVAPAPPVETVPEPQILVKPQGAPDTGDGSAPLGAASHAAPLDAAPPGLLAAGLGAAAALGATYLVVRRAPGACPADRRRGSKRGATSRTRPRSR